MMIFLFDDGYGSADESVGSKLKKFAGVVWEKYCAIGKANNSNKASYPTI